MSGIGCGDQYSIRKPPAEAMNPTSFNDKSYEILVREYHRRALAYALSLIPSEDDARDLVQEAFVIAYRNLDEFDQTRDFGSWLRGIVRMKYFELIRRRKRQPVSVEDLEALDAFHAGWDQAAIERNASALDALQHCLGKLQNSARALVDGYYFEKQRGQAIAARLGITEEAVWKRMERIRQVLLTCVNNYLAESSL